MKLTDQILRQIEESERLTKQLTLVEKLSAPNLSGAIAGIEHLQKLTAGLDLSKYAEAARLASGALASVNTKFALGGDLSEAVRKITEVSPALKSLQDQAARYEQLFRPSIQQDFLRLSEVVASIAVPKWPNQVALFGDTIQRQLESIRAPVIQIEDSFRSLRGFGELSAIGAAVRSIEPFAPDLVGALRRDLGDWRDADAEPAELIDDPGRRVALYEERGFNAELTDFPAQGFESALVVTGIGLGAVSNALAPPPAEMVPAFNVHAYQWLFVFERELRAFILKRLMEAADDGWEARLPPGMRDRWQDKRAKALTEGECEQPLIHYADFADYVDIILGKANWRDCFKSTFRREEAIREGFNRLRPIRLMTAHMRFMTQEEWLILNLEVRRILRAIGVQI
ncbi:Swt1 family HEPN domain-containing protein [Bradyrhizobium liaoningense]|uniref:Swt1 family HEPN domain-containing protein n=1 Tax=Bradyrhizobium liaoningense TaxID=43992 RepID=UPI001BAA6134|nr:Swt1 family HEPN domain-containing protein [Bradyrhizobium liaoningense]MBR0857830.1 hypothetical protein [Bradyrhizobium liaoningense]